jgi:hypothetical protein
MTKRTFLMLAASGVVAGYVALGGPSLSAHHSYAMFDQTKTLTVSGTVRKFQWTMPHAYLWLDTTDEKGTPVTYGFEFGGDGINGLRRAGWEKDLIKYGDKVTVTYAPLRDGRTGGLFRTLTRANGDVWDQNGQVPPGGRPAGQRGVNPNPGQ